MVGDKRELKRYGIFSNEMSLGKNKMNQIYHRKAGGKLRKMLTVYSDGEKFKLSFLIMDRTDPTRSEKAKGIKPKRIILMDKAFFFDNMEDLRLNIKHMPLSEMIVDFIKIFTADKNEK
ncbi:hypothetical protein [Arsenophonus nasoniae]|uniref:hypothetical protein n=1 Tax=Arsenophonus nasoniae TaxID=638 RepID=UPI003879B425